VIGIITFKLAGNGTALRNQLNQITQMQQVFGKGATMTNVTISADGTKTGFDEVEFAKETTLNLLQYLETGIGGARDISFLIRYLEKSGIKL
jgi:hypothetical protein